MMYSNRAQLSDCIAINQAGAQRPLVVVYCDQGGDQQAAEIAQGLGGDAPVIGLNCFPHLRAGRRTVEGIAASLMQSLLTIQPIGPYRVVGLAMCGSVAYEIATQLIGNDESIDFLGIVAIGEPVSPGPLAEESNLDMLRMWEVAIRDYAVYRLPIPTHVFVSSVPLTRNQEAGDQLSVLAWVSAFPSHAVRFVELRGAEHRTSSASAGQLGQAISRILACEVPGVEVGEEAQYAPAITIQNGNPDLQTVVVVPGAGDTIVSIVELAHALGRAVPVLGLQARGVDGVGAPHYSVEAAARFNLATIEKMRLKWPIHLIGHSYGGWVVLEMALQLQLKNVAVRSLTLVDSDAPSHPEDAITERMSIDVYSQLIESIELNAQRSLGVDMNALEGMPTKEKMRVLHLALQKAGLLPRLAQPDVMLGPIRTFAAAHRARYVPKTIYSSTLGLILARDPRLDETSSRQAHEASLTEWGRWAANIVCWHSPGNHFSALKPPHVKPLVEWWSRIFLANK